MIFATKEELLEQLRKERACKDGYDWAIEQESLEDILEDCRPDWRIWALTRGYEQFAENCPWDQLDGWDWSQLLRKHPQFAPHCDWEKLGGYDWVRLLQKQPQFAPRCDREKWSKYNMDWLLGGHPGFADSPADDSQGAI